MSAEDLQTVAEILLKPHQKTENKRIWVSICGWSALVLTIGFTGGNWVFWRSDTTDWKTAATIELKSHDAYILGEQAVNNAKQAEKNNSVVIKRGDR
jgi:hypothetical protein